MSVAIVAAVINARRAPSPTASRRDDAGSGYSYTDLSMFSSDSSSSGSDCASAGDAAGGCDGGGGDGGGGGSD
jgi:hypothetical protein